MSQCCEMNILQCREKCQIFSVLPLPTDPRHLISHDSLQENTTIENIVQALRFCAQRNEVFSRFGWRENDLERFHSSGKHKKETKRSSTSIFLQKVCRNLIFLKLETFDSKDDEITKASLFSILKQTCTRWNKVCRDKNFLPEVVFKKWNRSNLYKWQDIQTKHW